MAYRINDFLAKARIIQSKEEAKALCEAELEWIYQSFNGTTPHKVVNAYRKALRDNNMWEPFLRRPVDLVEDGETLDEKTYLPGYMRERKEHVDARFEADRKRIEERNTMSADAEMVLRREQVYLHHMMTTLLASRWQDLAVGVGMATGRRSIELCLTASMEPSTKPYHVLYNGQAKTRSAEGRAKVHEIPVLAPAADVCEALQRLQTLIAEEFGFDPENFDYEESEFDDKVGSNLRYAVRQHLQAVFPTAKGLSPRSLRNIYVALALESETPDGMPLCPPTEKELAFVTRVLGHSDPMYKAAEAYVKNIMPRLRRGIVLP